MKTARAFFCAVTLMGAHLAYAQATPAQAAPAQAASPDTTSPRVTDGPYVQWVGDSAITILSLCDGVRKTATERVAKRTVIFRDPCKNKSVHTLSQSLPSPSPAVVASAKKIFAVSDVEGNDASFLALLRAAGIVDANGGWIWGDGHLVLVGDMVDRGEAVTEVLWRIHRLEQEARKAGGYVHYVLGNHDAMLLYGDHRYVAQKYKIAAEQLGVPLIDLFAPTTEFGRWMRSKPVMIRIDSLLFAHGGLAPEFAAKNLDIQAVNTIAQRSLLDPKQSQGDSSAMQVFGSWGPLWYRGYFASTANTNDIQNALARYNARRVIVGHTVVDAIKTLVNGHVIAIDVTFKKPEKVEGLLIERGEFTRVSINGTRTPLR